MLKTLIDVHNYTRREAAAFPELPADRVVFRSGGVAQDALTKLAREIGLPPLYQACANAWTLQGISIGYFTLSPNSGPKGDLVADLRHVNLNKKNYPSAAQSNDFVNVASEEGNWICIGSATSIHPDVVFHIESMQSPDMIVAEISDSFDKLIILGANLHKISYWDSLSLSDGIKAMTNCCAALGCSPSQAEFWMRRISEMID